MSPQCLYLEHAEDEQPDEDLPPTSRRQSWGLPAAKRRIEPSQTLEETSFSRVKEGVAFVNVVADERRDHRPVALRGVCEKRLSTLCDCLKAANSSMAVLRYVQGSKPLPAPARLVCSPFATKHLRLPERFSPLWTEQSQVSGDVSREAVSRWKAQFLRILGSVNRDAVEQQTKGQASTDIWFVERVCRLTASKIKGVFTRQREFHTLVENLLYKEPPTHLPALHWGRVKEPEAVAMYAAKFPNRKVTECGLIVHPEVKFVAASPDRFVFDPDAAECEGLIEVKCPVATMERPEVAALTKKGFCLKSEGGHVSLSRTHAYYYQVMCQLSCTGRQWCDFVVMCGGAIFVERITFDQQFWEACLPKLKSFYLDYMLPELACPGK